MSENAKRAVRIFFYAFVPLALAHGMSLVEELDWRNAPLLAAVISAVGTTWRIMFPGVVQDDVVVGRVDR